MTRLFYITSLILVLGCANVLTPFKAEEEAKPPKPKEKAQVYKTDDVLNASFTGVWSAILAGLKWMKWVPAFVDEKQGIIRLKEAYVYRKSGKLIRMYRWPSEEEAKESRIDDYLEKVAFYDHSIFDSDRVVFTQEIMKIRLVMLSNSRTKVEIEYKVRPYYLDSDRFGEELKSNGYIESLLLKKIRENLGGKPLAGIKF
jgi:hypothetical protein